MSKKTIMSKTAKYLMLASILGTTALSVANTTVASAATANIEMVNKFKMMESEAQDSAITYVAEDGSLQVLEIPKDTKIEVRGHNDRLDVKIGKTKTKINNPKEIIFKGITVKNLVPFYTDSVEKVMLDGVNFEKGTDFSVLENLDTLLVKDSTFGATDYSLAIHSAPKLTTFEVEGSTFNADVRIYDNHALESSLISNSTIKDDVRGDNNAKGYFTDFQGNSIVRGKYQRQLTSGGMSDKAVFYINNKNDGQIGSVKYDANKIGEIKIEQKDGSKEVIEVPAGDVMTSLKDGKKEFTYTLASEGKKGPKHTVDISNALQVVFKNIKVDATISFVSPKFEIEILGFENCETELIDIAYSKTLKTIKVIGTAVSNKSGYLSVYNNKALEYMGIQDTNVNGGSGYISVYNNKKMTEFTINNTYNHGYLSAYHNGVTDLKIANSKFDDYISTDAKIEGEGKRVSFNEDPVLTIGTFKVDPYTELSKEELIDRLAIKAIDLEDGDITDKIEIIKGFEDIDFFTEGDYPITISITDSEEATVIQDLVVTVGW
ncbi:hypothetical protein [Vagococcus fessus]|uniref:Uncharacterized protein n=1 Tax=Vagococcus fessus TaxID=120370 RepID=A0A430AC49_9ENTE|nr:hypothetical protein [Vagococcus fessus]RSU04786.1 hypothetical protein CBF31_01840 [Vagococcus fessus]